MSAEQNYTQQVVVLFGSTMLVPNSKVNQD